ncbi:MAG: STAS domain-containing protein [Propioniciclava sp.]
MQPSANRHVVLDMSAVTDADVTAAETVARLRTWLLEQGVAPAFSRVHPRDLPRFRHLGIIATGDQIFATTHEAVATLSGSPPS